MNSAKLVTVLLVVLLPLVAVAAAKAPAADFKVDPAHWALEFENDTPKALVIEDPLGRLQYYWYMVYRVKNPVKRPLPCRPEFTLELTLQKAKTLYPAVNDRVAEQHLEAKIVQRKLLNSLEIQASKLKAGETREGVAVFRIGTKAPDFDHMAIHVRHLAAVRQLGRNNDDDVIRKFRGRVLNLKYIYVASRWMTGKELKLDGELWMLEDAKVPDRVKATTEDSQTASDRLKALKKKAEELRKRMDLKETKPPAGAAARPPRASPTLAGTVAPNETRKLLNALSTIAARTHSTRAAFTETVGRQVANGTIYLGKDHKFAIERVQGVGAGQQSIKELRVFDGTTLWAQTTTKEFGDSVRRCDRTATRKAWQSVDGRPEVDFATVANPVQAWHLFGTDLEHIGLERLDTESAYVFEVRPSKAYTPVLTGPLSSEVLYKAAGAASRNRIRFWIGAKSGFQLRMRVYDPAGNVLGSLECTKLELDAHIPADLLAYSPPAGVKVIDINTAVADSDKPRGSASP